ncbi:MAG: prepilin-type N-terminal cleavage/methylation domain-containing protein [Candidatus Omnitrophota bacterium]
MMSPIGAMGSKKINSQKGFTPLEIIKSKISLRIKSLTGFNPLEIINAKNGFTRRSLTGFTLIELVLVILLLSILTTLSTPAFRRTFSDLELRTSSSDLAKIISFAQEMAIIDRANYRVELDLDRNRYHVTRERVEDNRSSYEKISGRYGKVITIPESLKLVVGGNKPGVYKNYELDLHPDGRSDEVKIELLDKKSGAGRELWVKGFGGNVQIRVIEK